MGNATKPLGQGKSVVSVKGSEHIFLDPNLRSVASLFERGRWISWGHAAHKFKKNYSCTLLMVYWGCMEEPYLNLFCSLCIRVVCCICILRTE